jgi:cellulose synthase/poly-beta-1,6-N-acetylglucosamine synthase-like glycosyltransferase
MPEGDVSDKTTLSVVVPCFNEADNMLPLHERLSKACQGAVGEDYEIVYVNDGSRDATWARIHAIMQQDAHVVAVNPDAACGEHLSFRRECEADPRTHHEGQAEGRGLRPDKDPLSPFFQPSCGRSDRWNRG